MIKTLKDTNSSTWKDINKHLSHFQVSIDTTINLTLKYGLHARNSKNSYQLCKDAVENH